MIEHVGKTQKRFGHILKAELDFDYETNDLGVRLTFKMHVEGERERQKFYRWGDTSLAGLIGDARSMTYALGRPVTVVIDEAQTILSVTRTPDADREEVTPEYMKSLIEFRKTIKQYRGRRYHACNKLGEVKAIIEALPEEAPVGDDEGWKLTTKDRKANLINLTAILLKMILQENDGAETHQQLNFF